MPAAGGGSCTPTSPATRCPGWTWSSAGKSLFHFPDDDVLRALGNLRRRTHATGLLTTSFRQRPENPPIPLGSWRPLNLEAGPFRFPPPVEEIEDLPLAQREEYADKRLCLWRFADLPLT